MMWTNELVRILPPPKAIMQEEYDWVEVSRELATELPSDYRWFVETYGSGSVDEFLTIFSPFAENRFTNLLAVLPKIVESQREFEKATGVRTPFALYPEVDGLIPWARTDNGDVLWWRRERHPKPWTVLLVDDSQSEWEVTEYGAIEFLVVVLTKQFRAKTFPDSWPPDTHQFVPCDKV